MPSTRADDPPSSEVWKQAVLSLFPLTESHRGKYVCEASNGIGGTLSKSVVVSVRGKEVFELVPSVGEPLILDRLLPPRRYVPDLTCAVTVLGQYRSDSGTHHAALRAREVQNQGRRRHARFRVATRPHAVTIPEQPFSSRKSQSLRVNCLAGKSPHGTKLTCPVCGGSSPRDPP